MCPNLAGAIYDAMRREDEEEALAFYIPWCREVIERTPVEWFQANYEMLYHKQQFYKFIDYIRKHSPPEWMVHNFEKARLFLFELGGKQ